MIKIVLKKISSVALLLGLTSFVLLSQTTPDGLDLQRFVQIPPSPEAAGFIEYGNTDINYHLGRPNIAIPIYSHQGREMSLPISLSYSAGGIKTQQMASNVGLGWTLIAGGAITRIKLGMADDDLEALPNWPGNADIQGLIDHADSLTIGPGHLAPTTIVNRLLDLQDDIAINSGDGQADVYSLNTSTGLSTQIYWDYKTNKAYSTDDPTLKISATIDQSGRPISWLVIDASGTKYLFNVAESTRYSYTVDANEFTSNFTSTWFLASITSPNEKDVYQFNYDVKNPADSTSYWQEEEELLTVTSVTNRPYASGHTLTGGGQACPVLPGNPIWSVPSDYTIQQNPLLSITWNGQIISVFGYSGNRLDLPDGQKITGISISEDNENVKDIGLYYSHFGDTNGSEVDVRLKLDSIDFQGQYGIGQDSLAERQVWKFEYNNPDLVPSRGTNGVDYWGYYNGRDNSTTLVPSASWGGIDFSGANRSADITKSVYGTLTKLHFPTGGFNEFHYEAHDQIQVSESIVTNYSSLGSLVAGIDTNDPYDFCFTSPSSTPKAISGTITVDNESKNLRLSVTGGSSTIVEDEYVLLYLFPETTTWDHCYADSLANSGAAIRQYVGQQTIDFPLDTMANGSYRYLMYNSFTGSNAQLSYGQLDTITNSNVSNTIGGLRIGKIESKQADGTVSLTREFEYAEGVEQRALDFIDLKTTRQSDAQVNDFTCQTFHRYSNNLNTDNGKDVTYGRVIEKLTSNGVDNGYTEYKFIAGSSITGRKPIHTGGQLQGKLIEEKVYDVNDVLLKKTENFYSSQRLSGNVAGIDRVKNLFFEEVETVIGLRIKDISDGATQSYFYYPNQEFAPWPQACVSNICEFGTWTKHNISLYSLDAYFAKLDSSVVTEYFNGQAMVSEVSYTYDQTKHFQLTEQKVADSEGGIRSTKNFYPDDILSETFLTGAQIESSEFAAIDSMKSDKQHRINTVIQTEQYVDSVLLSVSRNNFQVFNGNYPLMKSVETAKDALANSFEQRIEVVSYDSDNNPTEIKQVGGTSKSFVWGYNAALPVVQADNISYAALQTAVTWAVTNMANKPSGVSSLETLLDYLGEMQNASQVNAWVNFNNKLREHPNITASVMLTTMAFNAMKAMLAQTDSNGQQTLFEYDTMGRLMRVIDQDGNVVKTYKYNLNGQQ